MIFMVQKTINIKENLIAESDKTNNIFFLSRLKREGTLAILKGIDAAAASGSTASTGDPVYPRAMSLKAAALYQMGRYEHALLNYHRADR